MRDPSTAPIHALVMPPERSIDIDTRLDFEMAEFLFRRSIELEPDAISAPSESAAKGTAPHLPAGRAI